MFKGSITALVTPFKDGKVDEEGLRALIEFQIENGANAILPCGTTGESATLSLEEHLEVIRITVEAVKGRVPVMAGTGSNCTREAVELTRGAKERGADGALAITPYYNKPGPEGLIRHFSAVAEVGLPVILYNVPGRTGIDMLPETVARLSKVKNIAGIKEATGDVQRGQEIIEKCGSDFCVLSGHDDTGLPLMAMGARGIISVTANLVPKEMAEMCRSALLGRWQKARDIHYRLLPLHRVMFIESNPVPAKEALQMMGKIPGAEVRLPLTPLSEQSRETLRRTMTRTGIL